MYDQPNDLSLQNYMRFSTLNQELPLQITKPKKKNIESIRQYVKVGWLNNVLILFKESEDGISI